MNKIKILAIPPDKYGVGKFRITNPYSHLQEHYQNDFHVDINQNVNDLQIFQQYDIIVAHSFLNNKISHEQNINLINLLKREGKIVIIDTDDYWDVDFRHPMYANIIQNKIPLKKIEYLKSASYITTTTPVYRDTIIKKLNLKNIIVFPNAIDPTEPQFISNPTKSNKIRFGYIGGSSHLHDIQLLTNGIKNMHDYGKEKIQFVLCGFDLRGKINEVNKKTGELKSRNILPEETVWYKYEQIFTNNYKVLPKEYETYLKNFVESEYDDEDMVYRRRWTRDVSQYAFNYNLFDVLLSPLVDSIFSANKSQLKIIEAGFHKKAVIASECNPYIIDLVNMINKGGDINSKGNSLLVDPHKNHKQWFQHMKRLFDNPNMIEDLGNNLYETVKYKYSLDKVNNDRSEFFKSILK